MVKTNRNFWLLLLLTAVTFGIYLIVFYCKLGSDVNKMCKDDGRHTMNYICALLLGLVTMGVFLIVWEIMLVCRVYTNATKKDVEVSGSIAFFIVSLFVLMFTVVCPIIALTQFFRTSNRLGRVYNASLESVPVE